MRSCAVFGCGNSTWRVKYGKCPNVHFYVFPAQERDSDRRNEWIKFVNRIKPTPSHFYSIDDSPWKPSNHTTICSAHFVGNVKSQHPDSPNYNPTILPPRALNSSLRYGSPALKWKKLIASSKESPDGATDHLLEKATYDQAAVFIANQQRLLDLYLEFDEAKRKYNYGIINQDGAQEMLNLRLGLLATAYQVRRAGGTIMKSDLDLDKPCTLKDANVDAEPGCSHSATGDDASAFFLMESHLLDLNLKFLAIKKKYDAALKNQASFQQLQPLGLQLLTYAKQLKRVGESVPELEHLEVYALVPDHMDTMPGSETSSIAINSALQVNSEPQSLCHAHPVVQPSSMNVLQNVPICQSEKPGILEVASISDSMNLLDPAGGHLYPVNPSPSTREDSTENTCHSFGLHVGDLLSCVPPHLQDQCMNVVSEIMYIFMDSKRPEIIVPPEEQEQPEIK